MENRLWLTFREIKAPKEESSEGIFVSWFPERFNSVSFIRFDKLLKFWEIVLLLKLSDSRLVSEEIFWGTALRPVFDRSKIFSPVKFCRKVSISAKENWLFPRESSWRFESGRIAAVGSPVKRLLLISSLNKLLREDTEGAISPVSWFELKSSFWSFEKVEREVGKLPFSALPRRLISITFPFLIFTPYQFLGSFSRSQIWLQLSPSLVLYILTSALLSAKEMLHFWEKHSCEKNRKKSSFYTRLCVFWSTNIY